MKELLKRRFELWVRMRWLKGIARETRKKENAYAKYKRHQYVAEALHSEYNKIYADVKVNVEGSEE